MLVVGGTTTIIGGTTAAVGGTTVVVGGTTVAVVGTAVVAAGRYSDVIRAGGCGNGVMRKRGQTLSGAPLSGALGRTSP
jgi:hypothetical protein